MNQAAKLSTNRLAMMAGMFLLALQWPVLKLVFHHLPLPWEPLLPGLAIFASAYLLSWAAEVAEMDIPSALALALLSLAAVAPEYAVDIYFAWRGGQDPTYVHYATANMTGGNRLLIGLGWALVVLAYCFKARKKEAQLEPRLRLETVCLLLATVYSFVIPLKKTLSLFDTFFFIAIFLFYFSRLLKGTVQTHPTEETAVAIHHWPKALRWTFVLVSFFLAASTIYLAAHPFAEGLLVLGRDWGVDEFFLVQWIAPLASESPEFIVALLFALKSRPTAGFNTIISSTVNQWTLLIGMVPLAYMLSLGHIHPMVLDDRQAEEIFLTSAQCFFGVVVLCNLRFSWKEGVILFLLFFTQAFYPLVEPYVGIPSVYLRNVYAFIYLGLGFGILIYSKNIRGHFGALLRVLFKPG
jgi:cation:H+ antiporter